MSLRGALRQAQGKLGDVAISTNRLLRYNIIRSQ